MPTGLLLDTGLAFLRCFYLLEWFCIRYMMFLSDSFYWQMSIHPGGFLFDTGHLLADKGGVP